MAEKHGLSENRRNNCRGFRKKILRAFGQCQDDQTKEWQKIHNQELSDVFQHFIITKENSGRTYMKKQGSIKGIIIENSQVELQPLGTLCLRWEECAINN